MNRRLRTRQSSRNPPKAENESAESNLVEDTSNDQIEPAPQIIMLRSPADIKSRGMDGRAARYYPETHQLFVNCLYAAIDRMAELLEKEFAATDDQDSVRRVTRQAAEQSIILRVGRALIFALAKRDSDWQSAEIGYVTSPASLSIAAEDFSASLPGARNLVRTKLDVSKNMA